MAGGDGPFVTELDGNRYETAQMRRNSHLAALNHGIFIAPRGLIALSAVPTMN
ncbi:MAG: hypothetical protein ACREQN_03260 [Candidatus Binataceae bacterium]